jgi:hypothetical protein
MAAATYDAAFVMPQSFPGQSSVDVSYREGMVPPRLVAQQALFENRGGILHTAPGVDQYLLRTREEAVAQAMTFAKRNGVHAWLSEDKDHWVLLNNCRVVESVPLKRGRAPRGALKSAAEWRD